MHLLWVVHDEDSRAVGVLGHLARARIATSVVKRWSKGSGARSGSSGSSSGSLTASLLARALLLALLVPVVLDGVFWAVHQAAQFGPVPSVKPHPLVNEEGLLGSDLLSRLGSPLEMLIPLLATLLCGAGLVRVGSRELEGHLAPGQLGAMAATLSGRVGFHRSLDAEDDGLEVDTLVLGPGPFVLGAVRGSLSAGVLVGRSGELTLRLLLCAVQVVASRSQGRSRRHWERVAWYRERSALCVKHGCCWSQRPGGVVVVAVLAVVLV